ncbi:MAG: 4Fe-4S dicluster domain-containing protein [Candidatus Bathyarchaeota archaeon]|nr:MAG: 4Fe-4S dicluster domain-containing protein [Candidatus Bathyarchaeota archaeon]
MRQIIHHEEVCMGCGLCEVYCKVQHSESKDIVKAYRKEQPKPLSRVRVEVVKPVSFAIQCRHCEDPPCVDACLSGALRVDAETGFVLHNVTKCKGCWTCIMVCPYSAILMDKERRTVQKCDFCQGQEIPVCVEYCPNTALEVIEVLM